MTTKRVMAGALAALILFFGGALSAEGPQGQIEELLMLDNDSVRVGLLTFPPGSASGRHLNFGPEMAIMLEGELVVITTNGREVLKPGMVHWLPVLTPHDARNESDRPARLWAMLLKQCD